MLSRPGVTMRSKISAAALATVLVLGGVACSDDDGGDEASSVATAETTTEAGLGAEVCDAVLGVGTAIDGGFNGPPTTGYVENVLLPAVDAVLAADVDELTGPAAELQAAAQAVIDGEEFFGLYGEIDVGGNGDETVYGLYGELAAAIQTGCGYEAIDVTAIDYEFEGVPVTLAAGRASFNLTNDGNEGHQMILFRRNDGGIRGSIEDILDLGEEGDGWGYALTTAGSTGPQPGVQPGQTGYLLAELEAGSYATVCFITGERMVAEFEVT